MELIILPYQAGLAVGITGAKVTEMRQGDNVHISEVTCELQPALPRHLGQGVLGRGNKDKGTAMGKNLHEQGAERRRRAPGYVASCGP